MPLSCPCLLLRKVRLSAVLPSRAFQAPLVGASVMSLLTSQKGPPLCRSPIWSLSSSASWWRFHVLSYFSERSSSLPYSYLSISSDSVESLLLAKAISYFQELLHLNRCVATAFRIILRASGSKVMLSNSYSKSIGVDFERGMKISQIIFFNLSLECV